jgi:hypothetical protein
MIAATVLTVPIRGKLFLFQQVAKNMSDCWRILILFAVCHGLCGNAPRDKVINFDVPGGAGAANYSGQGAYSDPGNNYWNPVVSNGTTGSNARLSDGITSSPITLTPQVAAPMVRREPGAHRRHCNSLTSTTMLPGTNIAITLPAESWHSYLSIVV